MPSRRDALAALLLALCAASLFFRLGLFPALSLDEAWMGLYAGRLTAYGLVTPHEMNTYTGPLYGLALARIMATLGTNVFSLRLLGAFANMLAFALMARNLRRRAGAEASAWWCLLLAGSSFLLMKSRLAWEVYVFQPLLLSLTFALLDEPVTWPRAALLAAITLFGVSNHFIYISVPLSLCVLYARQGGAWLRASASCLAASAVVFLIKPHLSDAAWATQRLWAVPLFFALIPLAATAAVSGEWEKPLIKLVPWRLLGLGAIGFMLWHGPALWMALAGPVIWKRLLSWDAPWWLDAPLLLWSAFLLAVAAWRAARAWHGQEEMSPAERTLALWPAAYAAVFILFRHTSSLRYYSLIQFLVIASAASGLAKLPRADRKPALALALFAALATQAVLWREAAAPQTRKPLVFKVGWRRENSSDFARKEALFSAFDTSGACRAAHQERSFTAIPLDFHRVETGPLPCDPSKEFDADYCRDCAAPPFYRWSVVSARP